MANLPPPEAQEMIRQFEEEQRARAEARNARRPLAGDPVEIKIVPRKQMTSREIEAEARQKGYRIEGGNGKHGKHIVAPDGSRISLPDHPGNLATGTCLSINRFLDQHREPSQGSQQLPQKVRR